MTTLLQKADSLDRRVLGETRMSTPEGWTRNMSRWWWSLVSGAAFAILISFEAATDQAPPWSRVILTLALGANALMMGYRAGVMRAEHERLQGRDRLFGRRRPVGL